MRLAGSLAVHALLGALLFAWTTRARQVQPRPAGTAIEIVDIASVAPTTMPAADSASATRATTGSSAGARDAMPARSAAAPARNAAARRARTSGAALEDPRGRITFDTGETGGGGEPGTGSGAGGSAGRGLGFGDGAAIAAQHDELAPPPPPPPPKISKARPARLIFPSRQREVEDAQLFVMKVTVDRDGYVSGARLVRGFGGRRDEVAQDQIWRFRYDPARDDDGRPIASTLEQRFLVQ